MAYIFLFPLKVIMVIKKQINTYIKVFYIHANHLVES